MQPYKKTHLVIIVGENHLLKFKVWIIRNWKWIRNKMLIYIIWWVDHCFVKWYVLIILAKCHKIWRRIDLPFDKTHSVSFHWTNSWIMWKSNMNIGNVYDLNSRVVINYLNLCRRCKWFSFYCRNICHILSQFSMIFQSFQFIRILYW